MRLKIGKSVTHCCILQIALQNKKFVQKQFLLLCIETKAINFDYEKNSYTLLAANNNNILTDFFRKNFFTFFAVFETTLKRS